MEISVKTLPRNKALGSSGSPSESLQTFKVEVVTASHKVEMRPLPRTLTPELERDITREAKVKKKNQQHKTTDQNPV